MEENPKKVEINKETFSDEEKQRYNRFLEEIMKVLQKRAENRQE